MTPNELWKLQNCVPHDWLSSDPLITKSMITWDGGGVIEHPLIILNQACILNFQTTEAEIL